MNEQLNKIKNSFNESIESISDLIKLDELRVKYLGKKGELTAVSKTMGSLSPEERPSFGQMINEVRGNIESAIEETRDKFLQEEMRRRLEEEAIDVTMPGKAKHYGHRHPMSIVIEDITNIFLGMGYEIAEGPDIEDEYHNFTALNIPEEHTARDSQDTFYVDGGHVLRSATSSVQVRVMKEGKLPIKIIAPGCVYRSDEVDATHSPVFHQLEALVIDKGITMGDLKGALEIFAKELFGENTKVRFRPHYFPFTEPSAEMDVSCFACGGKGCNVCKDSGFIEILGCGMVNPKVLSMQGIDPAVYSGFAFGMGLERVAMQRFGITDMRLLFENDVKFLKQF